MFHNLDKILNFLDGKVAECKVMVLGDIMLDRYYFGDVKRISPEAPVPVAQIYREQDTLGGAANVALNLFHLGAQVSLVGVTGKDESQRRMASLMQELPLDTSNLVETDRPTTTKLRVIGGHQQMIRLDFEEAAALDKKKEREVKRRIETLLDQGIDSIIISDYAKGVCTPSLCRYVIREADQRKIPVIIDPKGANWRKYAGASFITPNVKELAEAAGEAVRNEDEAVSKAALKVCKRFSIGNMVLTRSEKGMSLIGSEPDIHIPTLAQDVFDVSGAGDTVIAVLGAALAGKLELMEAALLANLAAGYVVGKVGTYAIHRHELRQAVLNIENHRIFTQGGNEK